MSEVPQLLDGVLENTGKPVSTELLYCTEGKSERCSGSADDDVRDGNSSLSSVEGIYFPHSNVDDTSAEESELADLDCSHSANEDCLDLGPLMAATSDFHRSPYHLRSSRSSSPVQIDRSQEECTPELERSRRDTILPDEFNKMLPKVIAINSKKTKENNDSVRSSPCYNYYLPPIEEVNESESHQNEAGKSFVYEKLSGSRDEPCCSKSIQPRDKDSVNCSLADSARILNINIHISKEFKEREMPLNINIVKDYQAGVNPNYSTQSLDESVDNAADVTIRSGFSKASSSTEKADEDKSTSNCEIASALPINNGGNSTNNEDIPTSDGSIPRVPEVASTSQDETLRARGDGEEQTNNQSGPSHGNNDTKAKKRGRPKKTVQKTNATRKQPVKNKINVDKNKTKTKNSKETDKTEPLSKQRLGKRASNTGAADSDDSKSNGEKKTASETMLQSEGANENNTSKQNDDVPANKKKVKATNCKDVSKEDSTRDKSKNESSCKKKAHYQTTAVLSTDSEDSETSSSDDGDPVCRVCDGFVCGSVSSVECYCGSCSTSSCSCSSCCSSSSSDSSSDHYY